ncbi:DNA/RNA non-specific endonuclease [Streptomyces sp. NBC_00704]|uniref:DNA/RNA non-specific endonuclease n=1 Tax=Streptomyces sp. NBC_00704 TaxID=2975809 RepID=UPI002E37FD1A|nr:DNA/RNA non-specific endonuclease [Streptomyces sp. NBC_00704]
MPAIRPGRPARRRARSTGLALVTMAALGLTTTGMSAAQPQTAAQQPQRAAAAAADLPAGAPLTRTTALRTDGEHCEPTRAGSKERRAGAAQACVSTSPAVAAPRRSRSSVAAAADTCGITSPGSYTYDRFEYCVTGVNVLYVLRDGNGKEIGRGTVQVSTSATLPAKGTAWQEQITARMTSASGDVTALNAKFRASCTSGCTTTKTAPWYGGDLVPGQSVSGSVAYSSSPAAGTAVQFTTSYKMYVTSPGATAVDPNASWDNPRKLRCDDDVRDTTGAGTPSPGCVVPSVTPVVLMRAQGSQPGGAVAAYEWAQQRFDDGWGQKKLLTRQKSGVADRTGRTCGSFDPNTDLVENDTCGEFPFAEAKEGGIDGARCAELIPNASSGGWDTYVLGDSRDLDPATPCVRAHVPPADKQFADAQLTEGFTAQRVVDGEQFKVAFTTPDAVPQARCLANPPTATGARPSGNGWLRNTTEPVPHVNKTITPMGPPGTRPSTAQACLGKTLGEGKPAKGDITGWQDAQKFEGNVPKTEQARCHLIANILGGPGQIRDGGQNNLVPCWQAGMNTGTPSMRTYEAMAQNKVKEQGFGPNDAIFYQVTPVFRDATSTIPTGVTMTATIERANGTTEELFPNVYVPNTKADTGLLNLGN